jgi:hypothetical protein
VEGKGKGIASRGEIVDGLADKTGGVLIVDGQEKGGCRGIARPDTVLEYGSPVLVAAVKGLLVYKAAPRKAAVAGTVGHFYGHPRVHCRTLEDLADADLQDYLSDFVVVKPRVFKQVPGIFGIGLASGTVTIGDLIPETFKIVARAQAAVLKGTLFFGSRHHHGIEHLAVKGKNKK